MPPPGEMWLVAGQEWAENPRYTLPAVWFDFVRLWHACRGGMGGIAIWPDAGGLNSQAAWLVDAFGRLASIDAELDRQSPRRS